MQDAGCILHIPTTTPHTIIPAKAHLFTVTEREHKGSIYSNVLYFIAGQLIAVLLSGQPSPYTSAPRPVNRCEARYT